MQEARKIPPFGLRMPEPLHNRVKEIAEQNRRSMNSEIVVILERAVFDLLENKKGEAQAS